MLRTKIIDKLSTNTDLIGIYDSRCLRMRFNKNRCSKCIDCCPTSAIKIEGGLDINKETCTQCMLCVAECPSGGLEINSFNFYSIISKLRKSSGGTEGGLPPVLACNMQEDIKAHINTFCMGFLSEEHLIALLIFVQAPLQLNLTECKSCKNSFIVDVLKKRLELVETKISPHPIPLPNGERGRVRGKIMLIEDKSDLQYQAIPYDRRGFFSALKKLTMKGAASFLDSAVDQKQMSAYGDKVLPFKRKLLNRVLSVMIENNTKDKESVIARSVSPHLSLRGSQSEPKQSQSEIPRFARNDKEKAARNDKEKGLSNKILANYYFDLVVDDNCDMCFACIGMCPTGALKEPHVSDDEHESINKEHTPLNPPLVRGELKGGMLFNASFCNGCGLCSDFCVQSSISIKHGFSGETPFEEKCVKKENG